MKKKFNKIKLLAALLCVGILTSCGSNPVQNAKDSATNEVGSNNKAAVIITGDMVSYDKDDDYSDWESQNPGYIKLNGSTVSVTGSGAAVNGSKVTITAAGVYAISGKLDNGQIIVDVQDKGAVRLVLNGAQINCSDNAPIYVKNSGKTIISLPDGTQNTITDGSKYVFSDPATEEPSAAIFSKDNLTVNGTGRLTVRAGYKDGIVSKDALRITGGIIDITSVDDGLIGRDMVLVREGSISIEAGGDGIKATNDEDAAKGYIVLEGGSFNIKAGADGIQAETSALIKGGEFTISTGGGSANAPAKMNDRGPGAMGAMGPMGQRGSKEAKQPDTTAAEANQAETQSNKAVKAGWDITVSGGTFTIDSCDDAIHSNNSINITGGDISITSGDDGIHADSSITIKGGRVDIKKSYEGIESMVVTVADGEIHVVSSDDGINVNGGNDGSSVNGRPGQNPFAVSENSSLNINGGYISVDSSGDGLDSNGSIYMTDGKVFVSGPTNDGNGALDYNGAFEISGGLLIAAGSSGMAEAPSEQSTQNSIIMYYPNVQQVGTLAYLTDSNGNAVAGFTPKKEYESIVISSPLLKKDSAYTLYSGGTSAGDVYQGGTKVVSFTAASSVTPLSEAGIITSKGVKPGGGNNPGFGERPNQPGRARP